MPSGAHSMGDTGLGGAIRAADGDDIAIPRAREYALLAALLARPPDAALLKRLASIEGDETPLGFAHQVLAKAAAVTDAAAAAHEYFELFIGVGRGELLPYGSYYQ